MPLLRWPTALPSVAADVYRAWKQGGIEGMKWALIRMLLQSLGFAIGFRRGRYSRAGFAAPSHGAGSRSIGVRRPSGIIASQ